MSAVSGFFNRVANDVTKFADKTADVVREASDPKYKELKEGLEKGSLVMLIAGAVFAVAAVMFAVVALAAFSPVSFVLGVACGVVAYNTLQVGVNLAEVAKRPAAYQSAYGAAKGLDTEKLTKQIAKNTFFLSAPIEQFVKGLDEALTTLQSQRR